jgi:CDP-diacylglycerol---glycerol-3-phosphate 3-phosphatidyltransferase
MRSLYALKPGFQALLRPVVDVLAQANVTPNAVTLGSLGLCAGYGALMAITGNGLTFVLLLPVLLLRMALNAIDGMLAREHGMSTTMGARLNEFADVLSDICLYLPFMAVVTPPWLVPLVVIAGILAEFAGVLGSAHGGERKYQGPFGKSDRAAFFAAVALAVSLLKPAEAVIATVFVMAAIGGIITAFNRLTHGEWPCRN